MNIQTNLPKMFDADKIAESLMGDGYAYFPIGDVEDSLGYIRRNWTNFLQRWDGREHLLEITRPGEIEVDLGLRKRVKGEGGARDTKYYFHMGPGVHDCLNELCSAATTADWDFISALGGAKSALDDKTYLIAQALDRYFDAPISDLVLESMSGATAKSYSHASLRALHYPACPGQSGAATHYDRCLLTTHCGDKGGSLWALIDGDEVVISPPAGFAVIFFGLRILWVSNGQIKPLEHWSVTDSGQDRQAFVNFVPVPLHSYQVTDNAQALQDFAEGFAPRIYTKNYHWRGPEFL